uniref:Uncharacterized protein n=1 Tax=Noccaea caerulescens TaxID=107243 RepID=A0A1J3E485_NOCCA
METPSLKRGVLESFLGSLIQALAAETVTVLAKSIELSLQTGTFRDGFPRELYTNGRLTMLPLHTLKKAKDENEDASEGKEDDNDDDDDDDGGDGDNDEQSEEVGRITAGIGRNLVNVFLLLQSFGASGNNNNNNTRHSDSTGLASETSPLDANDLTINQSDVESSGPEEEDGAMSLGNRIRVQRRILLGRSVSRRRRDRDREANQNSDNPR